MGVGRPEEFGGVCIRPGVERVGRRDILVGEGGVEKDVGGGTNSRFLGEGGVSMLMAVDGRGVKEVASVSTTHSVIHGAQITL